MDANDPFWVVVATAGKGFFAVIMPGFATDFNKLICGMSLFGSGLIRGCQEVALQLLIHQNWIGPT